jgi:hypothetical protein
VLQRKFRTVRRYKTDSGSKCLILKDLVDKHFFRFASQALDFAGLGGCGKEAVNKVIHINRTTALKRC